MMFDDIQEVNEPVYTIQDYREAIESLKEMQGGFKAAVYCCRNRSERELVDRLIQLADSIEILLRAFPPAGTYKKIS